MKNTLLSLLTPSLLLTSHFAFATGGFGCSGTAQDGKKVSIQACRSWTSLGLCSDIQVEAGGRQLEPIAKENVTEFFADDDFIAVHAIDDQADTALDLRYSPVKAMKKLNHLTLKQAKSGKTLEVKDLECGLE